MRPIGKRTALVASVAALAAGGGGAALAATQFDSPSERSDAIVAAAAKELGVEPEELTAALKKAEKAQVDADVAAGRLTKEQGDALKAAIDSGDMPLVGFGPGRGFGHIAVGGLAMDLDAAADYLGMTRAAVLSELRQGKSLAEIATDHGKSVNGLVTALVNAVKERLDERVAAGTLTREQANTIEANLEARIEDLVNRKLPAPPDLSSDFRLPGPGGHGFRLPNPSRFGLPEQDSAA